MPTLRNAIFLSARFRSFLPFHLRIYKVKHRIDEIFDKIFLLFLRGGEGQCNGQRKSGFVSVHSTRSIKGCKKRLWKWEILIGSIWLGLTNVTTHLNKDPEQTPSLGCSGFSWGLLGVQPRATPSNPRGLISPQITGCSGALGAAEHVRSLDNWLRLFSFIPFFEETSSKDA